MIYTFNYTPIFEDYTSKGLLSLAAITKIMENAGSGQTDSVGDCAFLPGRTWMWVMTEWKVEVLQWPQYGQALSVKTWSRGAATPLTTCRDYLMYTQDGTLVARGTTCWIAFDITTNRPLRISEDIIAKYQPEPTVFSFEEDPSIAKITPPAEFTYESTVQIQRRDIDINNHVHNLTYLDYAFEALPRELYRCNAFTKVRITFRKAILETDRTAITKYAQEGSSHKVFIYNNEGALCTAIELS